MGTWVTRRRTFTAVYSVRFISPEDTIYIYMYMYTYINNNNIFYEHVGIIITGMRAPRTYVILCVRAIGSKNQFWA